jgi:plastocyanin
MTPLRNAAALSVAVLLALATVLAGCGGSSSKGGSRGTPTAPIITNFEFSPNPIRVRSGTTVVWTNKDPTDHTVQADDGSYGSAHLGTGKTYSHTFSAAGTYTYHCNIHTYMKGTVVVS